MMLTGKAKTDYMRGYMRRRRAAARKAKPAKTKVALLARIRELEAELSRERNKKRRG